jgi:hypothetical protein
VCSAICSRNLEITERIATAKLPHFVDMDNTIFQVVRDQLAVELTNQVKYLNLLGRPSRRQCSLLHIILRGRCPQSDNLLGTGYVAIVKYSVIQTPKETKLPEWFGFERKQHGGVCFIVSIRLSTILWRRRSSSAPLFTLPIYFAGDDVRVCLSFPVVFKKHNVLRSNSSLKMFLSNR